MNDRLILAFAARKFMKHTILGLALGIFWSTSLAAQMSHEETIVRTAYARLSYAVQLGVIEKLGTDAWAQKPVERTTVARKLADGQLTFQLSDFSFGKTREIAQARWPTIFSAGTPFILEADFNVHGLQEEKQAPSQFVFATAEWRPGHEIPADLEKMTMADLFKLEWPSSPPLDQAYDRYASYSVTVSYQGKTAGPYKAVFFFGKDSSGKEIFQPQDSVTEAVALGLAMGNQLYPKTLLETSMRRVPLVSDWLKSSQLDDQSCSTWQNDVCCDLTALKCGIASGVLRDAMAKPLPPSSLTFPGEDR